MAGNSHTRGITALHEEPDGGDQILIVKKKDETITDKIQAPNMILLSPKATVEPAFLNLSAPKLTVESA